MCIYVRALKSKRTRRKLSLSHPPQVPPSPSIWAPINQHNLVDHQDRGFLNDRGSWTSTTDCGDRRLNRAILRQMMRKPVDMVCCLTRNTTSLFLWMLTDAYPQSINTTSAPHRRKQYLFQRQRNGRRKSYLFQRCSDSNIVGCVRWADWNISRTGSPLQL